LKRGREYVGLVRCTAGNTTNHRRERERRSSQAEQPRKKETPGKTQKKKRSSARELEGADLRIQDPEKKRKKILRRQE